MLVSYSISLDPICSRLLHDFGHDGCKKLVKLVIYPCGKDFLTFKEVPGWYTESVCNMHVDWIS